MKREKFIRYLKEHKCFLLREGAKHSVFFNLEQNKTSTVPRHKEVNDFLVKKICKDLDIEVI